MTNITKVPLSAQDKRCLTMSFPAVSTVTWFSGDRTRAIDIIAERMNDVVAANPWLLGKLSKNHKGKMCICYDADIPRHELPARASHLVVDVPEPHPTVAFGLPITEHADVKARIMLKKKNKDLREQFFKVAIIPCCKSPQDRFGVFVSMLHFVGDGHSFYRLYNMLLCEEKVQALSIHRVEGSLKKIRSALGFRKTTMVKCFVGIGIGRFQKLIYGAIPIWKSFIVDSTKAKALKESEKGNCSFISTNDLIISWLERCSESSYTHLPVNWRNRVAGITNDHVGNYAEMITFASCGKPDAVREKTSRMKEDKCSWSSIASHHLFVTNWSSFPAEHTRLDGCDELLHYPNADPAPMDVPNTTFAIVYRPRPGKIAVMATGSPKRIGAISCPFESDEPIHLS